MATKKEKDLKIVPSAKNEDMIRLVLSDGTSAMVPFSILRELNKRIIEISTGKEIDTGFNYSGLIQLNATVLTGTATIICVATNSSHVSVIFGGTDVYAFKSDEPDKLCFYKKSPGGTFFVKNNTPLNITLILSTL